MLLVMFLLIAIIVAVSGAFFMIFTLEERLCRVEDRLEIYQAFNFERMNELRESVNKTEGGDKEK